MAKDESSSDQEPRRYRHQPGNGGPRRKTEYDDHGPPEDKRGRKWRGGARGQGDGSRGPSEAAAGSHSRRGRGTCCHTEGTSHHGGREGHGEQHDGHPQGTAVALRGLPYEAHPDYVKEIIRRNLHGYNLLDIVIPWRLQGGCSGEVTVVFDTQEAAVKGSRVLDGLKVGRRWLEVLRGSGWRHWSGEHTQPDKPTMALPDHTGAPASPVQDEGPGEDHGTGGTGEQQRATATHGRVVTTRGEVPWRVRRTLRREGDQDAGKGSASSARRERCGPSRLDGLSMEQLAETLYVASGRLKRTAAEMMRRTSSGASARRPDGRAGTPGSSDISSAEDASGQQGQRQSGS